MTPTRPSGDYPCYGGACFGGDLVSPGEKASQIIVITGANSQLQKFQDLFPWERKNDTTLARRKRGLTFALRAINADGGLMHESS